MTAVATELPVRPRLSVPRGRVASALNSGPTLEREGAVDLNDTPQQAEYRAGLVPDGWDERWRHIRPGSGDGRS